MLKGKSNLTATIAKPGHLGVPENICGDTETENRKPGLSRVNWDFWDSYVLNTLRSFLCYIFQNLFIS